MPCFCRGLSTSPQNEDKSQTDEKPVQVSFTSLPYHMVLELMCVQCTSPSTLSLFSLNFYSHVIINGCLYRSLYLLTKPRILNTDVSVYSQDLVFVEGNDGNINLYAGQNQTYVNGFINGNVVDLSQTAVQQQQQGVIPTNLIAVCEFVAVILCVCAHLTGMKITRVHALICLGLASCF